MSLASAVRTFDGKHVADLTAAAAQFSEDDALELMAFCRSDETGERVAATWIVKALCDGGRAELLDMNRCFSTLATAPWEAALHLLQCVQYAPEDAAGELSEIKALLGHPKTLLRVWSLDAFVRFAVASGAHLEEAQAHVKAALEDDKASLRARARKLAALLDL